MPIQLEFLNITSYLLYILMKLLTGVGLNIADLLKTALIKPYKKRNHRGIT